MSDRDPRLKDLARIHALARALGLDEDAYREMLARLTGQRSARELDAAARYRVIRHLETLAWQTGHRPRRRPPLRPADDRAALLGKVRALLASADPPRDEAYADAMARRMWGVERHGWCTPPLLRALVAALAIDARRRTRPRPSSA